MRHLPLFFCLMLTGCCWWSDSAKPLPEPATDHGLSGAEASLDHLTDKRDSRVAAAVTVAKDKASEKEVAAELELAQAMLPPPTPADLAYAKDRADKGDDAFYAEQLRVSRQLAASIIEANKRYEAEKTRKQAAYEAALKDKELALAAEQEARQADKWTYAGIGLVTLGILAALFTPLKLQGAGVALTGIAVGAFPMLSKQPWFLPTIGGLLAAGVTLSAVIYVVSLRRKSAAPSDGEKT